MTMPLIGFNIVWWEWWYELKLLNSMMDFNFEYRKIFSLWIWEIFLNLNWIWTQFVFNNTYLIKEDLSLTENMLELS